MADVFISYKREDRDRIARFVERLEAAGVSVWWDRDVAPGETWERTLAIELKRAVCVIVVWSSSSVRMGQYTSKWVSAEVALAKERNALVPALFDRELIPDDGHDLQYADFTNWPNEAADTQFESLIATIKGRKDRSIHDEKAIRDLVARGLIRDEVWIGLAQPVLEFIDNAIRWEVEILTSLAADLVAQPGDDLSRVIDDLEESVNDAYDLLSGVPESLDHHAIALKEFIDRCNRALDVARSLRDT